MYFLISGNVTDFEFLKKYFLLLDEHVKLLS